MAASIETKKNVYGSFTAISDDTEAEYGLLGAQHYKKSSDSLAKQRSYFLPIAILCMTIAMLIVFTIVFRIPSGHISARSSDPSSSNAHKKPNFVILLADDLSWNSIGYVDSSLEIVTPTLTSLAKRGIIMDNFYAQEVCTPSRASLLTGRYPLSTGMQYGMVVNIAEWGLPLDEVLLPEVLKNHNYATHILGKWHLGHFASDYLPTARGFDSFTGFVNGENYYWTKLSPDDETYQDFMTSDTKCYQKYDEEDLSEYSTTLYTNKALDIIEKHHIKDPLFLLMSYQAVHDPFIDVFNKRKTNDDDNDDGDDDDNGDANDDDDDVDVFGIPDSALPPNVLSYINDNVLGFRRQQYMKSLYLLDESVSKITGKLTEKGLMDNTYIIFASDNGGCIFGGGKNGPLRGTKGALFEGGIKVDSFIYSPLLNLQRGKVYKSLMHISDWFPTILSLAGINYKPSEGNALDSVDHSLSWIANTAPRPHMLYNMYVSLTDFNFDIWVDGSFAVRNERYKLMHTYDDSLYGAVFNPNDPFMIDDNKADTESRCAQQFVMGTFTYWLFDLEEDPYEQNNLYSSTLEEHVKVKQELYDLLPEFMAKAKTKISIVWSDTATTKWTEADNLVVPWANSIKDEPVLCRTR